MWFQHDDVAQGVRSVLTRCDNNTLQQRPQTLPSHHKGLGPFGVTHGLTKLQLCPLTRRKTDAVWRYFTVLLTLIRSEMARLNASATSTTSASVSSALQLPTSRLIVQCRLQKEGCHHQYYPSVQRHSRWPPSWKHCSHCPYQPTCWQRSHSHVGDSTLI